MRPTLVLTFVSTALLTLTGCSQVASLFGGGEDLATKKQALEDVLKTAEAEATAMAAKLAEVAEEAKKASDAKQAEAPAADEAPVAEAPATEEAVAEGVQEDPDAHVGILEERLVKAGLGEITREILLPDLLGGLDSCDAPLRTKLHFEKGYATLARYPDAKAADKCLKEYLKMPGAAKFGHLYTLKGEYMLELHPRMESIDMNKIRAEFAAAMKD